MAFEKKPSYEQFISDLRQHSTLVTQPEEVSHLTEDEILFYIAHRFESKDEASAEVRVLQHISYCSECRARLFWISQALADPESEETPELNLASRQGADNIILGTEPILVKTESGVKDDRDRKKLLLETGIMSWVAQQLAFHKDKPLTLTTPSMGAFDELELGTTLENDLRDEGYAVERHIDLVEMTYENGLAASNGRRRVILTNDALHYANSQRLVGLATGRNGHEPTSVVALVGPETFEAIFSQLHPNRVQFDAQESLSEYRRAAYAKVEQINNNNEQGVDLTCISLLGAHGVYTPLSWLQRSNNISSGSLIERLNDALEIELEHVLSPVLSAAHPAYLAGANIGQASRELLYQKNCCFITTRNTFVAQAILQKNNLQSHRLIVNSLEVLLDSILPTNTFINAQAPEDVLTVYRLLRGLVLQNRQAVVRQVAHLHTVQVSHFAQRIRRLWDSGLSGGSLNLQHLYAWATIYRDVGDGQTELEIYDRINANFAPDQIDLYIRHAYATLLSRSSPGMAKAIFEELSQRESKSKAESLYVLVGWAGALLQTAKQRPLAQDEYLSEARHHLQQARNIDSTNPYALHLLIQEEALRLHFKENQEGKGAQDYFQEARALGQQNDSPSLPTLTLWASIARERGHLRHAEETGVITALEVLQEAQRYAPDNVPTLMELGALHAALSAYRAEHINEDDRLAQNYFQRVLNLEIDNLYALTAWADLDIQQQRFAAARQRLQQAATLAQDSDADLAPVYTTLAKLELSERNQPELLQRIREALEGLKEYRQNVVVLNMLAQICWQQGDEQGARRYIQAVLEKETPRTLNTIADLRMQRGRDTDWPAAADYYRRSLLLDPDNAYTLLAAGQLQWLWPQGDKELASSQIRRALALGLDIPATHAQMQRITAGGN